MFKEMGFWHMVAHGGLTLLVLIALSLWSWIIIVERWLKYRRAEAGSERLPSRAFKLVRAGQPDEARELAQVEEGAMGRLLHFGLTHGSKDPQVLAEALERKHAVELASLEQRLAALGTIGSVSPYIGLFGTVLGIIRAFQALARTGQEAGAAVVSAGIAEALVATAAGLAVAVPAVVFYNSFQRRLSVLDQRLGLASSELKEALIEKSTRRSGDNA